MGQNKYGGLIRETVYEVHIFTAQTQSQNAAQQFKVASFE